MISTPHRQTAIALIVDDVTAGARCGEACSELEISNHTQRRWTKDSQIHADQRPLVPRPEPANKLSASERTAVLDVCNSTEFASLPPSQIVPKLADQGDIWRLSAASTVSCAQLVSSITVARQDRRSGANCPPVKRPVRPARYGPGTSHGCPDRLWACFFYLYLIVDTFSRKIVGREVHEREGADLATALVRQAVLAEGCTLRPLVLHADPDFRMGAAPFS